IAQHAVDRRLVLDRPPPPDRGRDSDHDERDRTAGDEPPPCRHAARLSDAHLWERIRGRGVVDHTKTHVEPVMAPPRSGGTIPLVPQLRILPGPPDGPLPSSLRSQGAPPSSPTSADLKP